MAGLFHITLPLDSGGTTAANSVSWTSQRDHYGGERAVSDTLLAADAASCASRLYEIEQLARQLEDCAARADAVISRLGQLQFHSWQSPAGRAYRTTVALQQSALRRCRDAIQMAAAAVYRHRQAVASPTRGAF